MKNITPRPALFLVFCASLALGGDGDRQIISAPVIIEKGDTLRIKPGAELLFTGPTGITVKGHLQAVGTKERPIAFASAADTADGGTPFDWNGIEIISGGSAEIAYSLITNAMTGITANGAERLTLTECVFKANGQWHLSVDSVIQKVPIGEPYTYRYRSPALPTPEELAAAASAEPAAAPTPAKPPRDTRRAWRRALIGAGAATAIGSAASFYNAHRIQQNYNAYVPGNGGFDAAAPEERQRHFDKLRKDHGAAQAIGWALIGLTTADIIYLKFFF
jgi:hypothetical protein